MFAASKACDKQIDSDLKLLSFLKSESEKVDFAAPKAKVFIRSRVKVDHACRVVDSLRLGLGAVLINGIKRNCDSEQTKNLEIKFLLAATRASFSCSSRLATNEPQSRLLECKVLTKLAH